MDIEFDDAKDAINLEKHGLSLARLVDMTRIAVVPDPRFVEERYRFYGLIDGMPHCAAVVFRERRIRVISLRRAHGKEFRRHVR